MSGLKAEARRPTVRLPSPSPPCCPARGHSDNDDDLDKDDDSDDHVSQLGFSVHCGNDDWMEPTW